MKSQAWLASRGCTGLGQSSMEVIEARLRCHTTLPAAVRTRWEVPTNKLVGCEEQRPTHCTDGGATLIYRWGRLSRTVYDFKLSGAGIRRRVVRYSFPRYICWQCKTTFHQHAHQTKYGKYPFNDEMKEIGGRFAGLLTPSLISYCRRRPRWTPHQQSVTFPAPAHRWYCSWRESEILAHFQESGQRSRAGYGTFDDRPTRRPSRGR